MEFYDSEQEQVEALKKWWKENGTAIAVGLALGLGGVFGWTGWQEYKERQSETASALFDNQRRAVETNDYARSAELTIELIEDYPQTNYAALASLLMAKLAYDNDRLDDARRQLQWVLTESGSPELMLTARLRLARLNLGAGDTVGALALINQAEAGPFANLYSELKGDIYLTQNKLKEARESYQLALSSASSQTGGSRATVDRIQMKLNELGHLNFSLREN